MKKKTACVVEWQEIGGSFEIPDGWFVCGTNFDLPEPEVRIDQNVSPGSEEKTILVPKSLAYSLQKHFCGSHVMRETLLEQGRQEVIRDIRVALRL